MTATVETPIVPGPVQGPTREEPSIEALLLDEYRSLVHLAYLILPPAISRPRRIAAAHAVVHRALPPSFTFPPDAVPEGAGERRAGVSATGPREFMRLRVVEEATRQAASRSVLARLGSVLAPADGLGFEPCSTRADRTAITRRRARGRRVAVITTVAVTAAILLALLAS
ncbi:hypothetical protein [Kribbella solani]|uniref:Uncharacterized protein n=1 Tax=Kribbella solani TaxID=236067 RepID=A0A841DUI6_9ACTN|nr:hypothetical protein [Kribbella solani]MBB5980426.1 hypothetical protein [Kribbella solani]MDX3004408.1 hypothetical protein [Kribbella solani]